MTLRQIDQWLADFNLHEGLHGHCLAVLAALPAAVRDDLVNDPVFLLCDFDPAAGVCVPVGLPADPGGAGRSVAFKRSLCRQPAAFIRYVIAHELAHAHLRNEGRWDGDDPEHAADSLAAQWGFPRPLKG